MPPFSTASHLHGNEIPKGFSDNDRVQVASPTLKFTRHSFGKRSSGRWDGIRSRDLRCAFEYSARNTREGSLRLTAIFETWHFGDGGTYPHLFKGQLVNLSFEVNPHILSKCSPPKEGKFEQVRNAEYRFEGTVLRVYEESHNPLIIVQAGQFRFYLSCSPNALPALSEGDGCNGSGQLLLDHYLWVEFRESYQGSPNLLYPLRVSGIRYVKIPEKLISAYGEGMSAPTSLTEDQYSEAQAEEVQKMGTGEAGAEDRGFYLVDFDDSDIGGESIPVTFGSSSILVQLPPPPKFR
jgi:hypothetical protein